MFLIFSLKSYLTLLLAITAVTGDYIVLHSRLHIFQAVFDNATHSIIGGLSWVLVCNICKRLSSYQTLFEVAICAIISSGIDLDHFIAAKSVYLKDATNLKRRPFLHCSTLPLLVCSLAILTGNVLKTDLCRRGSLIVLTAFASHHIRDATRRGFWFYPFGSTQPIPYYCYVVGTCVIPYVISFMEHYTNIFKTSRHGLVDI